MAEAVKVEIGQEDYELLQRAKALKAALERVRERAHDKEPFYGHMGALGEALAWIAWCWLHGEEIDFAENPDGEVSDDLEDHWADELKAAFPDREDPVWGLIRFDSFDDPFRDERLAEEIAKEDAEGSEG